MMKLQPWNVIILGLKEIQHLKTSLLEKFLIKDLGNLKYFQGIEFSRSRKEIFISQRKYAVDIFKTHVLQEHVQKDFLWRKI